MNVLTMTNLHEKSGGVTQANLLAKSMNSDMIHYCPIGSDTIIKGNKDGHTVYYPSNSFTETIRELEPDAIVIHTISHDFIQELPEIKKLTKTIYVAHLNIYETMSIDYMRPYLPLILSYLQQADAIIAVSDEQKALLETLTEQKIRVIPPAIEYKKLRKIDSHAYSNDFLMSGRLFPIKNHITPIAAMRTVAKTYPDVFLRIYGNGIIDVDLNSIIDVLGMKQNIALFGTLTNEQMLSSMCECKALISSSIYENNSVSVIEADRKSVV